jgi:hypothetical protein
MVVTKRDEVAAKVLLDVLASAKHDVKGMEVMAIARVMEWAAELKKRIEVDLSQKASEEKQETAQQISEPESTKKPKVKKNGN